MPNSRDHVILLSGAVCLMEQKDQKVGEGRAGQGRELKGRGGEGCCEKGTAVNERKDDKNRSCQNQKEMLHKTKHWSLERTWTFHPSGKAICAEGSRDAGKPHGAHQPGESAPGWLVLPYSPFDQETHNSATFCDVENVLDLTLVKWRSSLTEEEEEDKEDPLC